MLRASAAVRFARSFPFLLVAIVAGVVSPSPTVLAAVIEPAACLPPHKYQKSGPPIIYPNPFGPPIVIDDVLHFGFTTCQAPPANPGDVAIHNFGSFVRGDLQGFGLFVAPAAVTVMIQNVDSLLTPGVIEFQTEMLQLDITGLPFGALIHESPTLPSLGMTTIEPLGGGAFRIDSFFDIFTELSLDGGLTWIPQATGPSHVEAVPAPGSLLLLASGLVLLTRRRLH